MRVMRLADFKNVSIVAHYIKERTKNAQFVIISLRNNMFELADRLPIMPLSPWLSTLGMHLFHMLLHVTLHTTLLSMPRSA